MAREKSKYIEWKEEGLIDMDCRAYYLVGGVSPTIMTKNNNKILINNSKIRFYMPIELFKLMGVKEEDFNKLTNNNDTQLGHLAGDSIVTTCLMAIFGQMLDIDYEQKINELVEEIIVKE